MSQTKKKKSKERPFIIDTYYKGIVSAINTEIDYLTSLINHAGTKGQANEEILKNLLIKFLPKKFSIGSGIIFDKYGNFSNQIDIIIYDAFHQPEILGHSSQYLFPVDIVYAAIEIKTIINKKLLKESMENIISVKKLKVLEYEHDKYTKYVDEVIPPVGIIFSYKSTTKDFNTFYQWFNEISKEIIMTSDQMFEKCYILQNTFSIKLPDLVARFRVSIDFCHYDPSISFAKSATDCVTIIDSSGNKCRCDVGRGFLIFLSDLLKLLLLKETYKGSLLQKYFPFNFEDQTGDEVNIRKPFTVGENKFNIG